jgi:hypothetical protein
MHSNERTWHTNVGTFNGPQYGNARSHEDTWGLHVKMFNVPQYGRAFPWRNDQCSPTWELAFSLRNMGFSHGNLGFHVRMCIPIHEPTHEPPQPHPPEKSFFFHNLYFNTSYICFFNLCMPNSKPTLSPPPPLSSPP